MAGPGVRHQPLHGPAVAPPRRICLFPASADLGSGSELGAGAVGTRPPFFARVALLMGRIPKRRVLVSFFICLFFQGGFSICSFLRPCWFVRCPYPWGASLSARARVLSYVGCKPQAFRRCLTSHACSLGAGASRPR